MSEQNSMEQGSPSTAANRVIKLWTPRNIFWLGIFLGWPSALVLCIINWFRMGLWKKALVFTGGGIVALTLFLLTSFKMADDASRIPLLFLNILLLVSFQVLMSIDFASFGYPNANFRRAGIGWGILISIITLVAIFGSVFFIILLIELVRMILAPNLTAATFAPLHAAYLLFSRS